VENIITASGFALFNAQSNPACTHFFAGIVMAVKVTRDLATTHQQRG